MVPGRESKTAGHELKRPGFLGQQSKWIGTHRTPMPEDLSLKCGSKGINIQTV